MPKLIRWNLRGHLSHKLNDKITSRSAHTKIKKGRKASTNVIALVRLHLKLRKKKKKKMCKNENNKNRLMINDIYPIFVYITTKSLKLPFG